MRKIRLANDPRRQFADRLINSAIVPRWIYNVEPALTPPSEQRVAELLANLGNDFMIRWGFYYTDNQSISREGDFVIQGPGGHVLVMEAKAGPVELDEASGRWGTSDGENPFYQLDNEWQGVIRLLRERADKTQAITPFVDRVLALPDVMISPEQTTYQGQPRDRIVGAVDLKNFATWWRARFASRHVKGSAEEAADVFEGVFAGSLSGGATHHTLDFADQILEQQTRLRYEILDSLAENEQLLFSGGPGTGKTWLAIEQAARWAKGGRRVLFLCYNLELESYLRVVCGRRSKGVEVFSFESLAAKLLGKLADLSGKNLEERSHYFDAVLPRELLELTDRPEFFPEYDALVVDEAQDHDTSHSGDPADSPGWWKIYLRLLRNGGEAPVAIFYDCAQRLSLRSGQFDPVAIRNSLLQPVNARLKSPVRYTRQLRRYLARLQSSVTFDLVRDFQHSGQGLPEGPEPECVSAATEQEEGLRCVALIKGWLERGLAKPHEIAVLFPSSRRPPSWIGKIAGVTFDLGENPPKEVIRALSIHKAKGLERRGIVLVGLPPWQSISEKPYEAITYVMGATRAQNLLGIVCREDSSARSANGDVS